MESSQFVALAALALLSASVVCDLRSRTIPDSISIALAGLGLAATALRWHDVSWAQLSIGLSAAFGLGAGLFYLGAMGGGDAKLCGGIGAVCGWPGVFEVLFATALAGGVLAFVAKQRGMTSLPYAPAIAAGYAITMTLAWISPPCSGLWHLITRGAL